MKKGVSVQGQLYTFRQNYNHCKMSAETFKSCDYNFLADRTYGRAIATVLRPSSSSSVTLCIVAKRCVLEQKLLLRA